ncbi:DUF6176 family protein [Zunongwangia pacifica]|uniref:DUF6176 family protein n=1 Tax=Zunongwangia pacifica TaxID=2911062 RepID=A0A9X2CQ70_9FLAO|nr:DUF6176 family protein [Zunongwangia pacifica]MCL6218957.1 DUF6176 family protein [Zunongwangia pacifica]
MERKLFKYRILPEKVEQLHQWMQTLNSRKEELLQTIENEKVYIENIFFSEEEGFQWLYFYMLADDIEFALEQYVKGIFEIDRIHLGFAKECIDFSYTAPDFKEMVYISRETDRIIND